MGLKSEGVWSRSNMFKCCFMMVVGFAICVSIVLGIDETASSTNLETNKMLFVKDADGRRKLDDIAGSITIDCGIRDGLTYIDPVTNIGYVSDTTFISSGQNNNISSDYISQDSLPPSLKNVRSFPQGSKRNCYTLRPPEGKASIYLIRATFMYGNYDGLDRLPEFSLYVGVNFWDTVKFDNASHVVIKEIIHVSLLDDIYVCLVDTDSGTPFISALELRHFHNSTYNTQSGSLLLYQRLDFGSTSNQIIRYHDDVYDRIWLPYNCPSWTSVSTSFTVDSLDKTNFNLPSKVMRTAARPSNVNGTLNFEFNIGDPTLNFYIYMHFAELESLQKNELREFDISLNGNLLKQGIVLKYLSSTTIASPQPVRGAKLNFSLSKSQNSILPPILNAMEIYIVRDFRQAPTKQEDVKAIEDIKSNYGIGRGWQGDPCAPEHSWDGLSCSYNGYNPPRITSLNLSSSGLRGYIPPSLSNLKLLEHLDLSNNSLTGSVPEFLSQLPELRTLNLEGNKLSGSVPLALIKRSNNGSLTLSVAGNPKLCLLAPCKEEKRSVMVPLIATFVPVGIILIALILFWSYRRRKVIYLAAAKLCVDTQQEGSSLKDRQQFTYVEIVRITNNFRNVIGKGGFGTVYHGNTTDGKEVAVKVLSASSAHGSSQFRTEAQLLMRVHHRNLASFIGYCNEGSHIAIIYEYMASGNLEECLSDKTKKPLTWKERLQIALDAAQGLEYLHHGCRPSIVHRDVKSANILLNEKLEAKIADFGFSKLFSNGSRSHLSTMVVGTIGYVDPEYYTSNRLTEKSDVYSFGVVLLELITGLPAIIRNHDENIHIANWVSVFLQRGDVKGAVDPRLLGDFDTNSAWKFMEIAMSCLPTISIQRPNMSHVVVELKECLEADIGMEVEGNVTRSPNSFEMMTVDFETDVGPEAR